MRKPVLRRGKTIWLGSTKSTARYPILRGHHETEVAIVGGGMTGAMVAQAFAEQGTRVIVVEAARVAQGSTAASTALLLQEPDYDLGALSRRYGSRAARRIWTLSHDAVRDFIKTTRCITRSMRIARDC
jgi:glycine/D-amino acid oxidase-like deaminating enzyme